MLLRGVSGEEGGMKGGALRREERRHDRALKKLGVRHVKRGRMVRRVR